MQVAGPMALRKCDYGVQKSKFCQPDPKIASENPQKTTSRRAAKRRQLCVNAELDKRNFCQPNALESGFLRKNNIRAKARG